MRRRDLLGMAVGALAVSTLGGCAAGTTRLSAATGGGKHNVGVVGYGTQGVKAPTESAPARTEEVILCQPVPPSLLEIKRTSGKCNRYQRGSRHDRQIVHKAAAK